MKSKINKSSLCHAFLLLTFALFGLCTNVEAQKKHYSEPIITFETFYATVNYLAQIFSDGTIIYEGNGSHTVKGKRRYKISKEKVEELISEFKRINYFSLKDKYKESNVEDSGWTSTSFFYNGQRKKIISEGSPEELQRLEEKIEETVIPLSFFDNKMKLDRLFRQLQNIPTAKLEIINYGNAQKIARRESEFKTVIRQRGYDINRVQFVRRKGNKGIRTEFQIITSKGEKEIL